MTYCPKIPDAAGEVYKPDPQPGSDVGEVFKPDLTPKVKVPDAGEVFKPDFQTESVEQEILAEAEFANKGKSPPFFFFF